MIFKSLQKFTKFEFYSIVEKNTFPKIISIEIDDSNLLKPPWWSKHVHQQPFFQIFKHIFNLHNQYIRIAFAPYYTFTPNKRFFIGLVYWISISYYDGYEIVVGIKSENPEKYIYLRYDGSFWREKKSDILFGTISSLELLNNCALLLKTHGSVNNDLLGIINEYLTFKISKGLLKSF